MPPHHSHHILRLGVLLVLAACGGTDAAKSTPVTEPSAAPAAPGAPSDSRPAPAATEPPLVLDARAEVSIDGVGLHVINAGDAPISLAADVALEQKQGDGYKPAGERALVLRLDCASSGCVKLAPGAELVAPSWLGRIGGERCDTLTKPGAAGEYRFVVKSCSGGARAEVPFVIPQSP